MSPSVQTIWDAQVAVYAAQTRLAFAKQAHANAIAEFKPGDIIVWDSRTAWKGMVTEVRYFSDVEVLYVVQAIRVFDGKHLNTYRTIYPSDKPRAAGAPPPNAP